MMLSKQTHDSHVGIYQHIEILTMVEVRVTNNKFLLKVVVERYLYTILKWNREQLRKYNHKSSGRSRTCDPVIPVQRSSH